MELSALFVGLAKELVTTDYTEAEWVELRDEGGKLQGMWDPGAGVLEIQRRGVKTRYWLGRVGERPD